MAVPMPSPQKHRDTGVYWFRQRVPKDLRPLVGKTEVTRTLGTKDLAEAKILHGPVMAEVAAQWAELRRGQQALTHKEIQALAGEFYRELVKAHENEPGSVDAWTRALEADKFIIKIRKHRPGALFGAFGPDAMSFLEKRGLLLSTVDLMRFVSAVSTAKVQAYEQLISHAQGDYRPHPDADRFPAIVRLTEPKPEHQFPSMWAAYAADRKMVPRTVRRYHTILREMTEFVGKTDMAVIGRDDLLRWRDALEKRPGVTGVTIRDSYLAAAKAFYGWAVFKSHLTVNPALGVNVTVHASAKMRGFSDKEAATILSACLAPPSELMTPENAAARRWVPWLCAYTGARVNEITQLRASDVMEHEDVWIIRISPEAGTVKTGEGRLVALHPHLIEQGFVQFSFGKFGNEPLFYVPVQKAGVTARPQYESVGNRLADWVRGLGIMDPRVAPNHGWRHRYKTLRRRYGIDKEVVDAIQGHAPATEGDHYGETEVAAMLREISKLPRYEVAAAATVDRRRSRPSSTKNIPLQKTALDGGDKAVRIAGSR